MFKKRINATLAIDLALEVVRVLDVQRKRNAPRIVGCASQPVEAGPVETLPQRQLAALQALFSARRMAAKHCVAALPTALVVTRSVSIDAAKPQSPEEQIHLALSNCLPFDTKDFTFDYWPVTEARPNARTREILVVATRESIVRQYLGGFTALGLSCTHLDVAPCAMAALVARAAGNAGGMSGAVVLGETTGYFAIVERHNVLFWRPFDIPAAAQKAISAVQTGLDRVGDEISKCVSHMVGSMHLDNLSQLLLFGHGADDAAFAGYLNNRFHIPVRAPSPFDVFSAQALSADVRSAFQVQPATFFATAAGLAMQPAGVANHG